MSFFNKKHTIAALIVVVLTLMYAGSARAVTTTYNLIPSGSAQVLPPIPSPPYNVAFYFEFPEELTQLQSLTIYDDGDGIGPGSPGIFTGFDLDAVQGFDAEGNPVYADIFGYFIPGSVGSTDNPLYDDAYGPYNGFTESLLGTGETLPTTGGLFGLTDYVLGAPDATGGFTSLGVPLPQNFLSLGDGGIIHLGFSTPIFPNPDGPDLIIYEVFGGEQVTAETVVGSPEPPIPEPLTAVLMLSGLGLLGLRNRLAKRQP